MGGGVSSKCPLLHPPAVSPSALSMHGALLLGCAHACMHACGATVPSCPTAPHACMWRRDADPGYVRVTYLDIFKQFFIMGWIGFGGPAAHSGEAFRQGPEEA